MGCMSVPYTGSAESLPGGGAASSTVADDGLLGVLAPVWQIAIGGCVLFVLVAASARLARRGRSRMTTALLVTGAAIIGLAVIGVLTGGY
jgi:hypothetical protein